MPIFHPQPDGQVPAELNGVALTPWADYPRTAEVTARPPTTRLACLGKEYSLPLSHPEETA